MIEQVKMFVHEMRRITLLREELWIGTLNQIHSDVNKRMEQLTSEINKVNSNSSLNETEKSTIIKEKYEILLQPFVSLLEHVHSITTNLIAETPNEENFQKDFGQKITDALNELKNINNAFKPSNGWILFKQLHQLLHQRSQRRQSTSLLMENISPKLSMLKSSTIPLPGKDGQFCTIHSIPSSVVVLPTKTKPKKLFFIGSNGKKYPYLFKGLEDLHLDERIMQFLSITNTMFTKNNRSEFPNYHALHYSVTPLGPRSGLISWVEGSTPLFALYKKWQQREAFYLATKQPQQQQPSILRPNDIFYNKLNPILKEKGLTNLIGVKNFTENRQECPPGILRQVLEELIKDTPKDLLSRELWCNSTTPGNWWKSVQLYSRSTAVISMIGYVIGLGDRHLDNVLVNLNTGEVAHIDYNICFEKGHNLRVPEKVPFRMTQNLENALGSTGIEGLFRLSSEHVMRTLRRGRETLLTLLEAFVYDPLLDWTSNDTGIIGSFYGGGQTNEPKQNETKESRRLLEKKMTYRLLSIRLIENRSSAEKNQDYLIKILKKLELKVDILCDLIENHENKEDLIRLNELTKIYLDESLTLHSESIKTKGQTQHPVYSLHDRYDKYQVYQDSLNKVFEINNIIINDFQKMKKESANVIGFIKNFEYYVENSMIKNNDDSLLTLHFDHTINLLSALELYQSKSIKLPLEKRSDFRNTSPTSELPLELAMSSMSLQETTLIQRQISYKNEQKSAYLLIKEFMNSIGQGNLLSQVESLDNELESAINCRKALLEASYNIFTQNLSIFKMLPEENCFNEADLTKILNWSRLIKDLLTEFKDQCIRDQILKIYNDYTYDFNPYFRLVSVKHKSALNCVEVKDLKEEEMVNNKIEEIQFEGRNLQEKMTALALRKTNLTTGQEDLVYNHDMIEMDFFQFIENEHQNNQEHQNQITFQIFESFSFVLLQFLNDNLQKWIMMENASIEAKENLVTMTSIDGDWFLEEMLSLMVNCNHLAQLIRRTYTKYSYTSETSSFIQSLEIFDSLPVIFGNLKDLIGAYENDLCIDLIQMSMQNVNMIHSIINDFQMIKINDFFEMITQQDFMIENFEQDENCIEALNEIKSRYSQLLLNSSTNSKNCVNVLVGMDKLFSRIDSEFDKLIKFIKQNYNEEHFKIGNGQSSYFSLTPNLIYLLDDRVLNFYKSIFFVKKIQTIFNIISGCVHYNEFCFGSNDSCIVSQEQLVLPLRTFISEFIVQMLAGIPTIILGNLINKLKENKEFELRQEFLRQNNLNNQEKINDIDNFNYLFNQYALNIQMNEAYYNYINQFLSRYDHIWSNIDLSKRINSSIKQNEIYLELNRCINNSINWYHGLIPKIEDSNNDQESTSRQIIMNELEHLVSNLRSTNSEITSLILKLNTSEQLILKRLEWAVGSNPGLLENIREFENQRQIRNDYFTLENKLTGSLETIVESWFNSELLRNKKSLVYTSVLKKFETLLLHIEEEGFLESEKELIQPNVTEVEINLMKFQDFIDKKVLTNSIIQDYYKNLFEELALMKRNKQKEERDCSTKVEELLSSLSDFKTTLNQHNKVMNDIKPLLKTMNKFGENEKLQNYTKVYYEFSDNCQSLVRYLTTDEILQTQPCLVKEKILKLNDLIPRIYKDINGLNSEDQEIKKTESNETFLSSNVKEKIDSDDMKKKLVRISSKTGKAMQECNSYAVNVWKRVNQKLEGKDRENESIEASKNVEDQVDYIINQATDLNNLSQLYEGWTSWV